MASNIDNLRRFSELAYAAYAMLPTAQIQERHLTDEEFTTEQAERLVSAWRVIDQYDHSTEPYWTYDPNTGTFPTEGIAVAVPGHSVIATREAFEANDAQIILDYIDKMPTEGMAVPPNNAP